MTRPGRPAWAVVAAAALAAVALRALAFAGTDLYADEAYYWLWAQRPAAGYFDHPPLVAWLIRAGGALAAGEVGVRIAFLALGGVTVVLAALVAREISDDPRAPAWAALLALSAPLLHLTGALALPDGPVAAAYTAAVWLAARARGTRWAWAGLAAGLALLAKYSAALLAPALLLVLPWDRDLRRQLASPWPWVGAALAVAVFAPCLAWNARHGFESLRFQLGHGFARNGSLSTFLDYAAGQLAGAGPVVLVAGVAALVRPRSDAARRVAAAALLPLAVTTWSAARGRVEANWPALAYPALAAAAAAALVRLGGRGRALAVGAAALSLAALAVFAVEQRRPRLLAGTPAIERLHGWRATAEEARALAQAACAEAGCPGDRPFVYAGSYQYAAELAFYGGFDRLGPVAERRSQLDLWADRPTPGEPVLFVGLADPTPAQARTLGLSGPGPARRATVRYQGRPLRAVVVVPFGAAAGRPPAR